MARNPEASTFGAADRESRPSDVDPRGGEPGGTPLSSTPGSPSPLPNGLGILLAPPVR
jgi:hypothetical protein